MQRTERRDLAGLPDSLDRLRVDVVGVLVARMDQRAVPGRVPGLESVDADQLRGHPDVSEAAADDLPAHVGPGGVDVVPGGDVEPLDDDGAVETLRVDGTPDDESGLVWQLARRGRRGLRRGECIRAGVV